jgi:hypothetical protein
LKTAQLWLEQALAESLYYLKLFSLERNFSLVVDRKGGSKRTVIWISNPFTPEYLQMVSNVCIVRLHFSVHQYCLGGFIWSAVTAESHKMAVLPQQTPRKGLGTRLKVRPTSLCKQQIQIPQFLSTSLLQKAAFDFFFCLITCQVISYLKKMLILLY